MSFILFYPLMGATYARLWFAYDSAKNLLLTASGSFRPRMMSSGTVQRAIRFHVTSLILPFAASLVIVTLLVACSVLDEEALFLVLA